MPKLLGATPAILCVLALMVPQAGAGEYHVYSCRTPAGAVAPTDGWTHSTTGLDTFAEDTCTQGGALVAGIEPVSQLADHAQATWSFTAPPNTTLGGATLWRAGDAEGGWSGPNFYMLWFAGPANLVGPEYEFGRCASTGCRVVGIAAEPMSEANRLGVPPANLGDHLYADVGCVGEATLECPVGHSDPNGYAAALYLYAADLLLEQTAQPTVSAVTGELSTAPTIAGTTDIALTATDPASGVYEAVFSSDGRVVQRTVLNTNDGRCQEVGVAPDGLPAFLWVQPCPASVSADVGFDTTRLPDGVHHLVVSVTDAAGNAAPVLDRTVTVANPTAPVPGPPNGVNASAQATLTVGWRGTSSERLTRSFGHAASLAGRLIAPGGLPIPGARIEALATDDYAGARTTSMPTVLTGPDGSFVLRLPATASSRTLRFVYRSELGTGPPAATRTLTLAVRAGLRLTVTPHTTSVGHTIHFTGALRGGPIPATGKAVVLEARASGGPWIEFEVVHSDRHGRLRARYRFRFPGPAAYQFRALCEDEADYPYATGASNVVGVLER